MKARHWVFVGFMGIVGVTSTVSSVWLKANTQAFYMPSSSMEPTLPIGSRILGNMHAYDSVAPSRNDIALLDLSDNLLVPGSGGGTTTVVKRVVGVPGDRVELKKGILTVNGTVQKEPFVQWKSPAYSGPPYEMKVVNGKVYSRDAGYPWAQNNTIAPDDAQKKLNSSPTQAIPPDRFLVLGDNRSNSNDSHIFGLVPRSTFVGRVAWQYWPGVHSF